MTTPSTDMELGLFGGNTLLTKRMPIPKPKVKRWRYEELIPQFASREDYYQVVDFEDLTNQELNGGSANWLDQQGLPSIAVLPGNYLTTDWREILAGMQAVLAAHAA